MLEILRPDDWHLHLRDGAGLAAVLPHTAAQFARAIVMPNLRPPVRTVAEAAAYRQRILDALPAGLRFEPLMTLYLTDNTPASEIEAAAASGFVKAVKYYPAGATTNSDSGVTDLARCEAVFEALERTGLLLLMHGEVTDHTVDVFDREAVFIERHLQRVVEAYPRLKVVLEHVTTRQGIEFVRSAREGVAATLTAHHLLLNRNAMFQGGIRPHAYCLPVLKREEHRRVLMEAAISGNPRFFLGATPRRPAVAARGCTRRMPRSSCMPKPLKTPARSIDWKASPATSAPTSTACRAIPTASGWRAKTGRCPRPTPSAATPWCRCARARTCAGACWAAEAGSLPAQASESRRHPDAVARASLDAPGKAHLATRLTRAQGRLGSSELSELAARQSSALADRARACWIEPE